jgi:hypothetical protein
LKVALGTFKYKGDELVAFLEPRVGTKPSLSGDAIEIEDEGLREGVRPRHVKTYIKRFLYMNGVRKKYRVFVSGKELTIQEIEVGEEEKAKEKEPAVKQEEQAEPEEPETPSTPEGPEGEPKEKEEEAEKPEAPKTKKTAAKKPRSKKKKA